MFRVGWVEGETRCPTAGHLFRAKNKKKQMYIWGVDGIEPPQVGG